MTTRLAKLAAAPHLPRRTVRLRLTLLYGALFLASGAALLAITYALVRHSTGDVGHVTTTRVAPARGNAPPPDPAPLRAQERRLRAQAERQRDDQLHELLVQSGIALGVMAVASVALGWLVAGRVLRPLRAMTATTRRISERNLHERLALAGPRDELTELGDTIDELLARLESAFDAQRRFVANASHELRTPLAMMRTSLDVAAGKPAPRPPELAALDVKLREGLDRADHLLEGFLALTRAQHGALPDRTTVSLPELAAATLERQRDAIAERGVAVEHDLGAAEVSGSRTLLGHLVDNLLDNAVAHNEPSGWIRIQTSADDTTSRLTIANGGPQLDPERVAELAQPFRRLDSERSSPNGLGLGLSIVAAIADAHDGHLELRAQIEGGLLALVELPRARDGAGRTA